jgi:ankyrin repeat protein/Ca2+-binding EF-hand superfamily protein
MAVHLAAARGHHDMVFGLLPREEEEEGDEEYDASASASRVGAGSRVGSSRGGASEVGADFASEVGFSESSQISEAEATRRALDAARVERRKARQLDRDKRRARRARDPGTHSNLTGVNAPGHRGWTVLHYASHGCHLDIVERILRNKNAEPSPVDITGATPLHLAAESGSTAIVEALLAAPGVDASLKTDAGFTPLHLAAISGQAAACRSLIRFSRERTAELIRDAEAAAERAAVSGAMAKLRKNDAKAVRDAAEAAAEAIVAREFAEDDAGEALDVDQPAASGYTALHLASMRGQDRVVELLLGEGAKILAGDDDRTPVHLAAECGSAACLTRLLASVRDPAAIVDVRAVGGVTPALLAANRGREDAIFALLRAGADPFIPDAEGNTCLHGACAAGKPLMFLEVLRRAAAERRPIATLDKPNVRRERPLHFACRGGSLAMARALLDRGADATAEDDRGRNALMAAAETGAVGVASLLVEHARQRGDEKPLGLETTAASVRWTALRRSLSDVVAATRAVPPIDVAAPNGASAMAFAAFAERRLIASLSHGEGDEKSFANARPKSLWDVINMAQEQYKRRQRDRHVNHLSEVDGYSAMHVACDRGHAELARLLLNSGADVDVKDGVDGDTPLHLATREGHMEIVKLLVSRGASQTKKNALWYTPLHLAARNGDVEALRVLADAARAAGDDVLSEVVNKPRKDGTSPLHSAVELGHHGRCARELLLRGADWNARTIREESVLHKASMDGNAVIVRLILGAREEAIHRLKHSIKCPDASDEDDDDDPPELEDDPLHARDSTESTPLHWACEGGHLETVKLLVEAGASANIGGMWRGSTAVHLASRNGHVDVVKYLHSIGANMNAQDSWNYATPLILAAEGGHAETCAFLLDRRVDAKVKDKFGTTAAQNARTAEVRHIVHAAETLRSVVLFLHGATTHDAFLGWRDAVQRAKVMQTRDAKGTWQMVFALWGKNKTATYYWLWRQWEMRGRRRRRTLDDEEASIRIAIDAMTDNPGFAGVSVACVDKLARSFEEVSCRRNETVFAEGDPATSFYVLKEGKAKVTMTTEDDDGRTHETRVARLKTGSAVGEVALRFDAPRVASLKAVTDCVFLRLDRDAFAAAMATERAANVRLAAMGGGEDRPRTMLDPNDPVLVAFSNEKLARPLEFWERDLLATLFSVETYDPGRKLPATSAESQIDDGYVGLVLRGSVSAVTTRRTTITRGTRSLEVEKDGDVVEVRAGDAYFSMAAIDREEEAYVVTKTGARSRTITRVGVNKAWVPAGGSPAVVAIMQGEDVKAIPEELQGVLFRKRGLRAPPEWRPPPRRSPPAFSSGSAPADANDPAHVELAALSNATRKALVEAAKARAAKEAKAAAREARGADGDDDGSDDDGSDDDGSDDDDDDESPIDAHGLKTELVTELTEAFKFVDTDNGGDIDEKELKFAARALGFEPRPEELKATLDAMDEDGGGTVDLGEFISTVTERIADATTEDALDVAFECFDVDDKGCIVLEDISNAAKIVGDNVTSEELDELMNLGAADVNDDGEIDREEFATIMDFRELTLEDRLDAARREMRREAIAAENAKVRLLPIRPRSRVERRSLRTFPVVTLHPRFPFNF